MLFISLSGAFLLLLHALFIDIAYCSRKELYFYIYEWPDLYHDVWPPADAKLVDDSPYSHKFRSNDGLGQLVNEALGLYQTWQFSMYRLTMNRLLHSPLRTRDPSKASAFIIPFDLAVHSYIDHQNGFERKASPHARPVTLLLNKARQDPVFWKNSGHDHFLLFSVTAFQRVGVMTRVFCATACKNCTTLAIETTPMEVPVLRRSQKSCYAVPYPSSYHYHSDMSITPWTISKGLKQLSTSKLFTTEQLAEEKLEMGVRIRKQQFKDRPILSLFLGSVHTENKHSNRIRRILQTQCNDYNETSYQHEDGRSTLCVWKTLNHSCNALSNFQVDDPMLLFLKAQYCLAPPGDSLTRKSLFDALISGCVPVIHMKKSLTQYHWFLSEKEVEEISVYIPVEDLDSFNPSDRRSKFKNGVGASLSSNRTILHYIKDVLLRISPQELLQKQLAIARVAPRLQYSVVPSSVKGSDGTTWSPPQPDAVDVIIARMLDATTIAPLEGYSNAEWQWRHKQNKFLMENDEQYTGRAQSINT